jgi:cytochrome P450
MTCYIVYHVIKHPEVKKRLQQELDVVLGTDLSSPINYEDLNKLVYTDAVIKETSRLMPVTSINLRVAAEDDILGGYPVKVINEFEIFTINDIYSLIYHFQSLPHLQYTEW